jgi:GNAT superfamily N-acetyltransferase
MADARSPGTPPGPAAVAIRPAVRADVPLIRRLIEALAEYERLRPACMATDALLERFLFGERPYAEVAIAEVGGEPAGFALFFHNFSTFLARPGIYLEDLFVEPAFRGRGIGTALLRHLAQLAVARDCGRLEWSVLDWNEDAIRIYRRLGAEPQDEWTVYRVSGDALARLAGDGT